MEERRVPQDNVYQVRAIHAPTVAGVYIPTERDTREEAGEADSRNNADHDVGERGGEVRDAHSMEWRLNKAALDALERNPHVQDFRTDSVQPKLEPKEDADVCIPTVLRAGELAQRRRRSSSWRIRRDTNGSINYATGDYGMLTVPSAMRWTLRRLQDGNASITSGSSVVEEESVASASSLTCQDHTSNLPRIIELTVVNDTHAETCSCESCNQKRVRRRLKCCKIDSRMRSLATKLEELWQADIAETIKHNHIFASRSALDVVKTKLRQLSNSPEDWDDNEREALFTAICNEIKAIEVACNVSEWQVKMVSGSDVLEQAETVSYNRPGSRDISA